MENSKKIKNGKWKTGNKSVSTIRVKCCRFFVSIALVFTFAFYLLPFALRVSAQEQPPAPSAPKAVSVPAVKEKKLPNGLTIAVAERKNVPLVTVQLLIRGGASLEALEQAGLANMTADLLTKGTKTRTATAMVKPFGSFFSLTAGTLTAFGADGAGGCSCALTLKAKVKIIKAEKQFLINLTPTAENKPFSIFHFPFSIIFLLPDCNK